MNLSDYPVSQKKLGAIYETEKTTFNVWAPTHHQVSVALYDSPKAPHRTLYPMKKYSDGVFSAHIEGDLHGKFYTFILDSQYEVTDPYCVSVAINSVRSAIVDPEKTNPENWHNHVRPRGNLGCDAILYEVHVADFSSHANSGMSHKGKFLAFTENGTKIENLSTGLDHLVELGITHVHLMPVYDYITVNEEVEADNNYNWGYDPEHFNAPEGSYATDANDPVSRILDLKTAIMALHEKGLKVVLDVVYNHTFRTEHSNFNMLAPNYYHRVTEDGIFSNGSGCGNEFASDKPMGRKFIIDSLLYWATEFKVDGFRFDLMALIDQKTIETALKKLRAIDPEMLFYGEPWTGGLSLLPDAERVHKGAQCGKGYALFNDDFRDAIKGDNDGTGRGYIHGNKDMKHRLHTGLVGSVPFDEQYIGFTTHPCESINYFNSHDNLILFDKLRKTSPEASIETLIDLNKLVFNILFTSQGTPFIHAGNEFLRDKKGAHNSYNAPHSTNSINWENKVTYHAFYQYVCDLIALRKKYACFRMKDVTDIKKRLHFVEENAFEEAFKDAIVYVIKEEDDPSFDFMLVAHNPSQYPLLLSTEQIKSAIDKYKKTPKSKKSTPKIERIFDHDGFHTSPRVINPEMQHLIRILPISSGVFKIICP